VGINAFRPRRTIANSNGFSKQQPFSVQCRGRFYKNGVKGVIAMKQNKPEADRLKKCGLKNTRRRDSVLHVLEESSQPMTAEQIFFRLKSQKISISLSTVYRILDVLAAKAIVLKVSSAESGSAMFEINRKTHRHYLICLGCRKMIPVENCPLGSLEKRLEKETGFSVTGHRLEIYGYCSECKKRMCKDAAAASPKRPHQ
jgi:Fur family ferric uptake transcriptional regulator